MIKLSEIFNLQAWNDILQQNIMTRGFLVNILDILVVWYLIYKLMDLLRGTKAIQVLKGIAVILIIRVVSGVVGLNTVSWLMNQVITYGVIATIIIFQPEVRRGLEHLGRGSFFSRKSHTDLRKEEYMVQSFDKAIQYMSKRKIGALITIGRKTGLEDFIETGIPLNAAISGELLINIFIPNTPLHDGAVIVKDGKLAAASAYLPLSENDSIPKEFGTRHRAALGISEVSDALTIIVSEETGDVSITKDGKLLPHLTKEEYLDILTHELVEKHEPKEDKLLASFFEGFSKGANHDK